MRTLDLDQLRAFLAVADLRGFTAAGEAVGATQSAVSLRIAKLEQRLGGRLLSRTPRSVTLTADGERFLPQARRIVDTHDAALAAWDRSAPPQVLRLGISDHAAGARLPGALKALRLAMPEHVADVVVGLSGELRASYDSGEIDAAVVRQDADRRDGAPLFEDPLVWAGAADTVDDPGRPLDCVALRGPCGVKAAMLRALDEAGRPWRLAFQGGSVAALQAALVAGLGVTALGRAHVPDGCELPGMRLPPLPASRVVLLSRLPAPTRTALAKAFRRLGG